MIEEEGIVVSETGKIAKISILKKSACESCAAAGVCHPGEGDRFFLEADNKIAAKTGQRVKLIVAPQRYVSNSLILYGVPFAALVTGAIVTKNVVARFWPSIDSDMFAFMVGTVCLLLSFLGLKMYNKSVVKRYKPIIIQILPEERQ